MQQPGYRAVSFPWLSLGMCVKESTPVFYQQQIEQPLCGCSAMNLLTELSSVGDLQDPVLFLCVLHLGLFQFWGSGPRTRPLPSHQARAAKQRMSPLPLPPPGGCASKSPRSWGISK